MKTLFTMLLTALAVSAGFAQKGKAAKPHVVVPPKVIVAFTGNFPEATKVKWEVEKDDYEAEFRWQGISKTYPDKKIDEAAKITKVDGSVSFEAEIGGKDISFDASGNVLKTEK